MQQRETLDCTSYTSSDLTWYSWQVITCNAIFNHRIVLYVFICVYQRSVMLSYPHKSLWHFSHTLTKKLLHAYPDTQRPTHICTYCEHCVYVEDDNTTGFNPSTCDFLQTGLVPVSSLNSPSNTGKSWDAG